MSRVRLGDIVSRIKDFEDKDSTDLLYYVGGEHFDNRSLTVNRKGIIKGSTIGPAFHTKFTRGDVLLMSRNPHLRKAGIVDFDGICSDVSYIIRTKDEKIIKQKFIPLLFQSDIFWNFAERNKKGSTNFFLNWSDFEKFEFDLPDIDEQEKLCEVLWAINDTIKSYQEQIKQCDELVKGQFVEMFGKVNRSKQIKVLLSEVVTIINGKDHKKISGSGEYGVYGTGGRMLDAREYMCDENTIIVGRKGTINKPYIVHEKCWIVDTAFGLYPKTNKLSINYLYYFIKQIDFNKLNKACTLPSLTKSDLSHLEITIPSIEEQNEFEKYVKHLDKSKFAIKEAMKNAQKIFDGILKESLK